MVLDLGRIERVEQWLEHVERGVHVGIVVVDAMLPRRHVEDCVDAELVRDLIGPTPLLLCFFPPSSLLGVVLILDESTQEFDARARIFHPAILPKPVVACGMAISKALKTARTAIDTGTNLDVLTDALEEASDATAESFARAVARGKNDKHVWEVAAQVTTAYTRIDTSKVENALEALAKEIAEDPDLLEDEDAMFRIAEKAARK